MIINEIDYSFNLFSEYLYYLSWKKKKGQSKTSNSFLVGSYQILLPVFLANIWAMNIFRNCFKTVAYLSCCKENITFNNWDIRKPVFPMKVGKDFRVLAGILIIFSLILSFQSLPKYDSVILILKHSHHLVT